MSVTWPTFTKTAETRAGTELGDYDQVYQAFSWDDARALLDYLPDGGLNICHEAVDRHVDNRNGEVTALRWIGRNDDIQEFTYADLKRETAKFANVLKASQIGRGDRVFSLLGRIPQLYIAALGTLKNGSVYSPLFAAFGPDPVRSRMEIGEATALVTTLQLYRRKVEPWRHELPSLKQVFLTDDDIGDLPDGTVSLNTAMATASPEFETVHTKPEDMALLHFTSGTTGRPKGAIHVHEAVVAHGITGRFALDLRPGDIYWCTADPGWVTGTSYGIISPLVNGVTMIVDEADFEVERWYRILEQHQVSVWYTAPTAVRMLMRSGAEQVGKHDLSSLRFLSSVGEPLNPEAVVWSGKTFPTPFHDNWWQTETGGIMIANFASMDVKPGSMGKPLPGITAGIVERQGDQVVELTAPGALGELALRPGWPSMMRGYLNEEERYRKCFAGGWYLSGDLVSRDADGYYWFVGRADDLIKSSGHLIGPFEVESALIAHPAVAEAAVIGLPDETAGEVVKAYVTLNPGFEPDDTLRKAIIGAARKKLGPAVAPRQVEFRDGLPKTRSGKIMRRLLKARELGLPEGDTSTLESS